MYPRSKAARNRGVRTALAGTICGAVLGALAGCGTPMRLGVSQTDLHRSYPLPSDGWQPGDTSLLALAGGAFHATLTSTGACAWIGGGTTAFLWPAGYTVRFDPTVLIDPTGKIVATEGETIDLAGGQIPASSPGRCARPGQPVWSVMSSPRRSPDKRS